MIQRYILPMGIVAGLHALMLLGNGHPQRPPIAPDDEQPEISLTSFELPEDPKPPADAPVAAATHAAAFSPAIPEIPDHLGPLHAVFVVGVERMKPRIPTDDLVAIPRFGSGLGRAGDGLFGGGLVSTDALDNPPTARFRPPPVYPYEFQHDGIEGEVVVAFVVERDGTVSQAQVVRSSHAGFERAALEAVRRWRFVPGTRHGAPVRFRMMQPLVFRIDPQA